MIKKVIITNEAGDSLDLVLSNPYLTGLIVEKIEGLGPGQAQIFTTETPTKDGGYYNSSKMGMRNILFHLKFMDIPDSVEEARQRTYKFFPISEKIRIDILTDNRDAWIIGYVESNDPDIFSNQSGCTISVMCPDPTFKSNSLEPVIFSGVYNAFEFPFFNEGAGAQLILSNQVSDTKTEITYDGDRPVGFLVTVEFKEKIGAYFKIEDTKTKDFVRVDMGRVKSIVGDSNPIFPLNKDKMIICTEFGNKFAIFERGANRWNILGALDKKTTWLNLKRGRNELEYMTDAGIDKMNFRLDHRILYEGI